MKQNVLKCVRPDVIHPLDVAKGSFEFAITQIELAWCGPRMEVALEMCTAGYRTDGGVLTVLGFRPTHAIS